MPFSAHRHGKPIMVHHQTCLYTATHLPRHRVSSGDPSSAQATHFQHNFVPATLLHNICGNKIVLVIPDSELKPGCVQDLVQDPMTGNLVRHNKGCNCKKSGCLKKYCECFQANILCSDMCKCVDCKNFEVSCTSQRSL